MASAELGYVWSSFQCVSPTDGPHGWTPWMDGWMDAIMVLMMLALLGRNEELDAQILKCSKALNFEPKWST